jgi:hypothetical protein
VVREGRKESGCYSVGPRQTRDSADGTGGSDIVTVENGASGSYWPRERTGWPTIGPPHG